MPGRPCPAVARYPLVLPPSGRANSIMPMARSPLFGLPKLARVPQRCDQCKPISACPPCGRYVVATVLLTVASSSIPPYAVVEKDQNRARRDPDADPRGEHPVRLRIARRVQRGVRQTTGPCEASRSAGADADGD